MNVFNSSTQRKAEAAGLGAFKAVLFHIFSVWEGKKEGKKGRSLTGIARGLPSVQEPAKMTINAIGDRKCVI